VRASAGVRFVFSIGRQAAYTQRASVHYVEANEAETMFKE
jgi:hypothetical protein